MPTSTSSSRRRPGAGVAGSLASWFQGAGVIVDRHETMGHDLNTRRDVCRCDCRSTPRCTERWFRSRWRRSTARGRSAAMAVGGARPFGSPLLPAGAHAVRRTDRLPSGDPVSCCAHGTEIRRARCFTGAPASPSITVRRDASLRHAKRYAADARCASTTTPFRSMAPRLYNGYPVEI